MARVTVEDCIDKVENRFELILLAGHRARMIATGAPLTVDRNNDKNPVVALREIAAETISPKDLEESLIESMQKLVEVDEPDMPPAALQAPQTSASGMVLDDQPDVDMSAAYEMLSEDKLLEGLADISPVTTSRGSNNDDDD